ncbi:hypothetical protein [Streptococcus equi]|uniref:hypothetical protein n=1 Tax=Streptococcus equi TaxID=1336 RepID=UPI001E2EB153|nr:hypothetical protein [Streptococcus equi]
MVAGLAEDLEIRLKNEAISRGTDRFCLSVVIEELGLIGAGLILALVFLSYFENHECRD